MTKQEKEKQSALNCCNVPQCKECTCYSLKYRSSYFWECSKVCKLYNPAKAEPLTEAKKRQIAEDEKFVREGYKKIKHIPMVDYSIFTGGK